MHIAPVVIIAHGLGKAAWVDCFAHLDEVLTAYLHLPLTIRAPGAAIEHVARAETEMWERVASRHVLWLAGGYSDPILTDFSPATRRAQLDRERTALEVAGVEAGGLWVGSDWEADLVTLAVSMALPLILFDSRLVEAPLRPGAVARAGDVAMAIPVGESLPGESSGDDLAVVRRRADDLVDLFRDHSESIVRPDEYLADHLPGPPLKPEVTTRQRSPEADVFYRKVLLLVDDAGDSHKGQDEILTLQSSDVVNSAADPSVHGLLLAARTRLDSTRHRSDSWSEVREVDWDADGITEIRVETATTTLIVDPVHSLLETWDDKVSSWPITTVSPPGEGALLRRLGHDGSEPPLAPRHLEQHSEGRGEVAITLSGSDGLSLRIDLRGRTVTFSLSVAGSDPVRIGPEIPVSLAAARVRVDGGQWVDTDEPLALSGHRFRFTDGTRSLLMASPRPCELFVRPLAGRGLMSWAHWLTTGDATYQIALTPS